MLDPCLRRDGQGNLFIEGFEAQSLGERFGTPSFLVCERHLREGFRRFRAVFRGFYEEVVIAYSYKANSLPAICAILDREGAWAEVVSGLELSIAERVHVKPSRIIFNGPYKAEEELLKAMELGVGMINVDSLGELDRISLLARREGLKAKVGVRISPSLEGVPGKFGLDREGVLEACRRISRDGNLSFLGLQAHLGTQIMSPNPYASMIREMVEIASEVWWELGLETRYLDLGGGFPIGLKPLHPIKDSWLGRGGWPPPPLESYASKISSTLKEEVEGKGIKAPILILEPGRSLINPYTFLLTRVVAVKSLHQRERWIIVDGGINLLPEAEHLQYKFLSSPRREGEMERVHIGGPLCMYRDVLGWDRELPPLEEGDILVIPDAGAYSISLSWQFTRPRAGVYLIREGGIEEIRRRETPEDILSLDRIPKDLTG